MCYSDSVPEDPYRLDPQDVADPPRSLAAILRCIGPGMILCASIVGSGELIATTTLGAQAGYSALWVILLSCFIKPVVQAEFGRYTIATAETGLAAFDRFPGPRWKVNWIIWAWAVMVTITLFQVGAVGQRPMGRATTDEKGAASFLHHEYTLAHLSLRVAFPGDARLGPSQAEADVEITGIEVPPAVVMSHTPSPFVKVVLFSVLGTVWITYAFAGSCILRIVRDGRRAKGGGFARISG